ncbi:MAG TPA: ergothioneine biosynthesis protein EgtB [Candidatus Angelobacter sp.]|nr:ergothioneine biosynthesis protein EgtB [Candidatus Angelobacter sp.]
MERYLACRHQTEDLTESLTPEDQMVQSCAEASPVKWHLAHTSWFFETFILSQHLPGYRSIDPRFRDLFNSYYNAIGRQPEKAVRSTFSRPSLEDVRKFRRHVDKYMQELLHSGSPGRAVLDLIELGINHEQQHQELLVTDIKHAFWSNPLRPAYQDQATQSETSMSDAPTSRSYPGGLYDVGASGAGFYFDNEAPRHKVYLQPFRLASRFTTNGEFLAFIDDGGYQRPELWLSDGWKVVQAHQWTAPLYWEKSAEGWMQFTLSGMNKVNESEPVCHVSYYEADAFARWAGSRLPTEFEWEVAATASPVEGNLLESGRLHPQAAPANASRERLQQIFGDVWEWTASAYLPYPGFQAAGGALGEYNGKFMSNQMILRGGSCATPRSHMRASYRNFYPPETRWQFSGIRLANDGV